MLSIDCLLTVKEYTAVPSPTISGGMSADRTDEFRRAVEDHLPVDAFTFDPHPIQPDFFGDVMRAELDTDRLPLNQYLKFVDGYARLLGVEDRRIINTGIDARTTIENRVPRPLADTDVLVAILIEMGYSGEIISEQQLNSIEESLSWVADLVAQEDRIQIQHHGGPNDLVNEQILGLINAISKILTETDDVIISCSTAENV
ncbi:hypothetical protein GRS48_06535 [Halorubrum sp. JWXQ-INN 858]|uniref:hypothetical protein n=1 Tax=Halorubrum sp. JWXQ-INN 858 TaxID=2690782 RepID=UPI001359BEE8|nr:hypothetical protein [Halorubrum sp. JWXQ-INN 858]MWV64481.1 hypothetical protein [Halorubrum sp. JWXQ-INN 858]